MSVNRIHRGRLIPAGSYPRLQSRPPRQRRYANEFAIDLHVVGTWPGVFSRHDDDQRPTLEMLPRPGRIAPDRAIDTITSANLVIGVSTDDPDGERIVEYAHITGVNGQWVEITKRDALDSIGEEFVDQIAELELNDRLADEDCDDDDR